MPPMPRRTTNTKDQPSIAQTTREAYALLVPDEPLPSGDPRYVPLDEARGGTRLAESLRDRLLSSDEQTSKSGMNFARLLLTGHRGCGKTTELFRLRELLNEEGFAVVYFAAEEEFDLQQGVSWWNVVLEMIWQLETQLSQPPHNLSLPSRPKEEAAEWLARIVTKKQERRDLEAALKTELGAGAKLPFVLAARAAFKALVKTGSSYITEIEKEVERRPRVLLDALEEIVRSVNTHLYGVGKRGLVLIVDGLEKMPLRTISGEITTHSALFIHNGDKLKSPPCHLLYTLPLTLIRQVSVGSVFPEYPDIMPMIHVINEDGSTDTKGIKVMCEVLNKRVKAGLFEGGVEGMLAQASGGHIRDFIRLARKAASNFGGTITRDHAIAAIDGMIDYYDNLYDSDFHRELVSVNRTHLQPQGKHASEMTDRLLVLPYRNHTSWYALHPCILRGPRLGTANRGKTKTRKK